MKYYKLLKNNSIIGVSTSLNFLKLQKKHSLLIPATIDEVEYIISNGNLYRDVWMKKPASSKIYYEQVSIILIAEEEYNLLSATLKTEQEIFVEEENFEIEEPILLESNPTFDYIQKVKLLEMKSICNKTIINGFNIILSDGQNSHFSLQITDQLNISKLNERAQKGENNLPYHADGELCRFYSAKDIMAINRKMEDFIEYHTTYYNSLKNYINSLENEENIAQVTYGMDIPLEYQSEVFKNLLGK
jgi:hypothetical protein